MVIKIGAERTGAQRMALGDAALAARYAAEAKAAADRAAGNADGTAGNAARAAQEAARAAAEAARAAAEAARAQAAITHMPLPGENGSWLIWDAGSGAYVDSGKPSRGAQGEKGELGDPLILLARYGETTQAELDAACEAGQQIFVRDQDDLYMLTGRFPLPAQPGEEAGYGYRFVRFAGMTQMACEYGAQGWQKSEAALADAASVAARYTKPDTGIPQADLADDVQQTLDSAAQLFTGHSLSGPVADFAAAAAGMPLGHVQVGLALTQAGSGAPSPENVRPVAAWRGARIVNASSAQQTYTIAAVQAGSGDPSPANVRAFERALSFRREDGTTLSVSSGTLDAKRGVLTIAGQIFERPAYTIEAYADRRCARIEWPLAQYPTDGDTTRCTIAKFADPAVDYSWLRVSDSAVALVFPADATDAAIQAAMQACAFAIVYAAPVAVTLTPAELARALSALGVNAESVSVSWAAEAGTVCAGTLDVTSGELTVTWAGVTLDGTQPIAVSNWAAREGTSAWLYPNTYRSAHIDNNTENLLCDTLRPETYFNVFYGTAGVSLMSNTNYSFAVRVPVAGISTVPAINAYLAEHPIQLAYRLAEPVTYRLTPAAVNTLLGSNHVWADCGEVTLTHGAYVEAILEKTARLGDSILAAIAPLEADFTASRNYTAGSYLFVGTEFYRVTAPIANGGAITPGINAAQTSVAEQLIALAGT